jgi:uncharacterized membrane protein YqhA
MLSFFAGLFARLRYLFVIPVLALTVLALAAMAAGVSSSVALLSAREDGRVLPASPAEMAGVVPFFVQAAFLFFLAAALASLFLGDLPVPQWMAVRNLHQLKVKVLSFVSVILCLFFLGAAAGADDSRAVLNLGGGIALVLGAILALLRFGHPAGDDSFCREGNRCLLPAGDGGRPPRHAPEQTQRQGGPQAAAKKEPETVSGKDWLDAQKDRLRFEVESLNSAMAVPRGGSVPAGQVSVGQAPRRHHDQHGRGRRRRGRGGGGGAEGGGGSGPQSGPPAG